jgi:hypothetical protein
MVQASNDASAARLQTPAERALMARISRYFARAIQALPNEDQAAALAASSDILAVIETLARQSAQASPEAAVRLRGAVGRQRLLHEEGGVIGPAQVAELLGVSRQAVGQRRTAGKLLGIPGPGGYRYPLWQFTGAEVLPGLAKVLAALAGHDPWTVLRFFLNGNLALPESQRPLDALRLGQLDAVLRAARLYDEQAAP